MAIIEFVVGGTAACGAALFTNPLEVAKTRMQLQGELMSRGNYPVYYKNVFHAFYRIAATDGIFALQKGLVPALYYQLFMNGMRLGVYQTFDSLGFIRTDGEQVSPLRSIAAAGASGCVGALIGSPFYMVKIHFQSMASKEIAVGHQHKHLNMRQAFKSIFSQRGLTGLWRGATSIMIRTMIGSMAQLTTYSWCKQKIIEAKIFNSSKDWKNGFLASLISGMNVVFFMTPFDVVSTRIYNQGICPQGRGTQYSGVLDCFKKIFRTEGILGFYKGWGASWFRIAPHTVLTLMFWDRLKDLCNTLNLGQKLG